MSRADVSLLTWIRRWSWRGLHALSGLQERLRRRFTPAGRVLLAGTFAAGLFGVDTRQSLSFQAFSLGAALLLLAWLGSLRRPRGIHANRQLPRYATVGEVCRYRVEVENRGVRPAGGLTLSEELPDPRPSLEFFLNTPVAGESRANPVDRLFTYPRWHRLLQLGVRAAASPARPLADLAPGSRQTVEMELTPRRRGVLRLDALRIARSEPLGLGWSAQRTAPPQRLLVLPRRYPVPPQRPPGRRRLQPGGVSLASAVGDSREFIGLRDYRPGDSPRHIHWAAWARSGEPVVKEYQDEYFSRQALILDSFAGPRREADFEAAVSVAASFVEPLQGGDALLDLMFVADRAYTFTGGRGLISPRGLLEVLACVGPGGEGGFDSLGDAVLRQASRLSACLCVLLAWDGPRRALVARLRALGLPLRVLVVGAPAPLEPGPMADRPDDLQRLDPARLQQGLALL